jgi:hypothetical protein
MDKALSSTPPVAWVETAIGLCEQIPHSLTALTARIFPAARGAGAWSLDHVIRRQYPFPR